MKIEFANLRIVKTKGAKDRLYFYPDDPRLVILRGYVQIGDEIKSVANVLSGGGGESADNTGRVEGNITFAGVVGEDATPLNQFEIEIIGLDSQCKVSQSLTWP